MVVKDGSVSMKMGKTPHLVRFFWLPTLGGWAGALVAAIVISAQGQPIHWGFLRMGVEFGLILGATSWVMSRPKRRVVTQSSLENVVS